MKIYYGTKENMNDVTEICKNRLRKDNIITIPESDTIRTQYFVDNNPGIEKYIFIEHLDITTYYNQHFIIKINVLDENIYIYNANIILDKLKNLHTTLKLDYGNFTDEFPEQIMAVKYIKKDNKVLEIGGNIGRNSIVISSILENQKNLVVLESSQTIANQLIHNKKLNNMNFHIENSALSKNKLIQKVGDSMDNFTIISDVLKPGYEWVNTITLKQLQDKYNIEYDTLVLDCEGAFYYILKDFPEILDTINLIIMENDYYEIEKKLYVDLILKNNNFTSIYTKSGGWGPCYDKFFEVWKKLD